MHLRDLALCVLLLALVTTFNALLPYVILIAVGAVIYWAIRQAAAWGEGIGYDDGYFDADE